jgi:arylsulfatase A-like enzyme
MDTARADVVAEPGVMTGLSEFAEGGCRFDRCFANAPWTLPSHSSIFTGKHPTSHSVVGKGSLFEAGGDLASVLGRSGYATAAFSNNPWISPDFGFDSFDEFVACWKRFRRGSDLAGVSQLEGRKAQMRAIMGELLDRDAPFTLANALYMRFLRGRYDSGARLTTRRIRNWLDELDDDRPFFAFANFMEPHLQYDPPASYAEEYLPAGVDREEAKAVNQDPWAYLVGEEPMDERDFEILRALYRAELSYLDNRLAELFEHLETSGLLEETAVFVLGDHGENIGDHGLMDHQYSLRDTLLHVPLIARYPPVFEPDTTFEGLVELRDLFPTMLELAGCPVPDVGTVSSTSLQSAVDYGTGREYAIAEYPMPQPSIETLRERYDRVTADLSQYDRRLRSVRTADWRYVQASDGRHELYEINEAGEEQASTGSTPDVSQELRTILDETLGTFDEATDGEESGRELSGANRSHLEDLGYL